MLHTMRPPSLPPQAIPSMVRYAFLSLMTCLFLPTFLQAQNPFDQAYRLPVIQALALKGEYTNALERIRISLQVGWRSKEFYQTQLDLERVLGQTNALQTAEVMLEKFPEDLVVLCEAWKTVAGAGKTNEAQALLIELNDLAKELDPKKLKPEELVALGDAARAIGADEKFRLQTFYLPATGKDPSYVPAFLGAARIAVDKQDFAYAAELLGKANKAQANHPDVLHLLAKTYKPSDRKKCNAYLAAALKANPNHPPSLLLLTEMAMDREDSDATSEGLAKIFAINPTHPEAHALATAQAALSNDTALFEKHLAIITENRATAPALLHLLGKKISQKRRFSEGAAFQRQALAIDPTFIPAKAELGQDLLRMGKEDDAWPLIEAVHEADKYNVVAYNLMMLNDHLKGFRSIQTEHFLLRMTEKEAAVYGSRAAELLEAGYKILGKKYGHELETPIVVEFFPQQQDFAIRTLGIPGGLGILGACFGQVITMNSPGSLGAGDSNWESTLWHEFCHSVTIGATRARIPRWFTEGLSVYEEGERDPVCRRAMHPGYRKLLKENGLIPLEKLSGALLAFNEPSLIDLAYFQSGLLVEFLAEKKGGTAINDIIKDLGHDVPIDDSMKKHIGDVPGLWEEFEAYVMKQADDLAPDLDFEEPPESHPARSDAIALTAYVTQNPNSFWGLTRQAIELQNQEKWEASKAPAKQIITAYPAFVGDNNAYLILARAHRELQESEAEIDVLQTFAERSPRGATARGRLIELHLEKENWGQAKDHAERLQAVNPLLRICQRGLGEANQALGNSTIAVQAFKSLLTLQPANPSEAHYRLAQLYLKPEGKETEQTKADPELAKRHVLMALEEAPRFRDAHALLQDIQPVKSQPEAKQETP